MTTPSGESSIVRSLSNSLAATVGAVISSQVTLRAACLLRPRPMPHQFAAFLDHPWRLRYRHPGDTLGLYGVGAGMTVLDLGCGTGVFTVEMANRVGANGLVHAVDIQRELLVAADKRLAGAGLSERVHLHWCGAYDLPLADDSVDVAVLIATLPQIPDRFRALAEVRRVLKPEGRLAISEEVADPSYVPPNVTRGWAEEAGFIYGGRSGSLFCYNMIFFNSDA